MASVRVLGAVQAVAGVAMVATPERLAVVVAGGDAVAPSVIVRVLGGREIAQGLVTVARPSRDILALGVAVDLAHLASMVALALLPRWRRSAAVSGGLAAASALAGMAVRRGAAPRR